METKEPRRSQCGLGLADKAILPYNTSDPWWLPSIITQKRHNMLSQSSWSHSPLHSYLSDIQTWIHPDSKETWLWLFRRLGLLKRLTEYNMVFTAWVINVYQRVRQPELKVVHLWCGRLAVGSKMNDGMRCANRAWRLLLHGLSNQSWQQDYGKIPWNPFSVKHMD